MELPEINAHIHGQLTFDKSAKNKQLGKGSLSGKWCCWNWISVCRRVNFYSYIIYKSQLKYIYKKLCVRARTVESVEDEKNGFMSSKKTSGEQSVELIMFKYYVIL